MVTIVLGAPRHLQYPTDPRIFPVRSAQYKLGGPVGPLLGEMGLQESIENANLTRKRIDELVHGLNFIARVLANEEAEDQADKEDQRIINIIFSICLVFLLLSNLFVAYRMYRKSLVK